MAVCGECGGFKNIYDRSERGKVFTQCWSCGNQTVEDDPLLQRPFAEIRAASEKLRESKRKESHDGTTK